MDLDDGTHRTFRSEPSETSSQPPQLHASDVSAADSTLRPIETVIRGGGDDSAPPDRGVAQPESLEAAGGVEGSRSGIPSLEAVTSSGDSQPSSRQPYQATVETEPEPSPPIAASSDDSHPFPEEPPSIPTPPITLTPQRTSSTAIDTTHATSPMPSAQPGLPPTPPASAPPTLTPRPPVSSSEQSQKANGTGITGPGMTGSSSAYPSAGSASSSLASAAARGMPMSCRACDKTFIPLFRKPHTCNHCGYQYCEADCSGQALLPRSAAAQASGGSRSAVEQLGEVFGIQTGGGTGRASGGGNGGGGYEVVEVCKYCMPMLQVTSGHASYLRSLPLKRLQEYTKAYGLSTAHAIEKEDFVQTILKAKSPTTGCLSPDRESYYRRRSVPKLGVLPQPPPPPRPASTSRVPPNNARPRQANGYGAPPRPSPQQARPPQPTYRPPPSAPPRAQPTPPKPAPTPKRAPSPPVPTISSLVALPTSYINTLSIGTLKAILFENHVRVNYGQILEKGELVKRVTELCRDERRRLERQAREEAAEEAAAAGLPPPLFPRASADNIEGGAGDDGEGAGATKAAPVPTGPPASVERDGLCVVCQENEAQLAVVDCGHLSMCQECSALVMKTSRECPLCRTRIVTEQRLIRIFRT